LNFFTPPVSSDTLDQISNLQSTGWNNSVNLRFTEPMGNLGMLQLSYSLAPQWTSSDQETFNYEEETSEYSLRDTLLSNVFENRYLAQRFGAGYMMRSGKLFFISRLQYQIASLDNDQVFPNTATTNFTFNNLLPFAMLRFRFEKQRDLRIIYRTSTNPPSATQLQNVVDNSNPLQLSIGNPELEQDYSHRFIVRYNGTNTEKNQVFIFFLSGQLTNNYIGNSNFIASADTLMPQGVFLSEGTQLSMPVNLDGSWNTSAFMTIGRLVNKIKTNVNLNLSGSFQRTPGLLNGIENNTNTSTLGVGLVLSSNISEKVDFTISSRTNINNTVNSFQASLNNQFINQISKVKLNLIFGPGIVFRSELNHSAYSGLSDGFNQNFWLWNLGLAKKFLKNNRTEVRLNVFDALRQNLSITRNTTELYIEDIRTAVLQRYITLGFNWQIRDFGKGASPAGS
ncbi:MAG: outer membrane beta-barrel protein, partial [Bacteroidota bacterium]